MNPTTKRQEADQPYPPGDPLGRVYTMASLADAILAHVFPEGTTAPRSVLDPACGRGALLDACRRRWGGDVYLRGVDIDPDIEGTIGHPVDTGDWLTIARFWQRLLISKAFLSISGVDEPDLIFANPPFGKAIGVPTTAEHVMRYCDMAPHVVVILPLPYFCGAEFDVVWRHRRPSRILRVTERPWPDRLREVTVFEWTNSGDGTTRVEDLDWHR